MGLIFSMSVLLPATILLAVASSVTGCITLLKGRSLIADALGHAAFPGLIIAFMIFKEKSSYILFAGAALSSFFAFIYITYLGKTKKPGGDALLAITLSGFFGLGMVLKSYMDNSEKYRSINYAGLDSYILGQAAYIMREDLGLIIGVFVFTILFLVIFYKEIKLYIFDPQYAKTSGLNTVLMDMLVLLNTILIISLGLKMLGAILVSSLFIIPAVAALQWTKSFSSMIIVSSLVSAFSAVTGSILSSLYKGMSTGPVIVISMAIIALISLFIGPHGVIKNIKMRRRLKNDI